LRCTAGVKRCHPYPAWRAAHGLADAIAQAKPDLLVPCDDRALDHLLTRPDAARAADDGLAALIARSVGDPARSTALRSRAALLDVARQAGARVAATLALPGLDALPEALAAVGPRAVLKSDGTWGGSGVAIVDATRPEQAVAAYERLARPQGLLRALKRLIVNHDPYPLGDALDRRAGPDGRQKISIQAHVDGQPANCLAACWQGEVLALVQVAVEETEHDLGPSAIVRIIDHPDIRRAAEAVFGAVGVSGLAGLDFIIERATGVAYLIEMNQRATPIGHLALGPGRDPVAALAGRAGHSGASWREPMTERDLIALFPMAWCAAPGSPLLREAYPDVPWLDPGLARELIRPPIEERGFLARLIDWRMRGRVEPMDTGSLEAALAELLANHEAWTAQPQGKGGAAKAKAGRSDAQALA
jgi:hypothetical protein